MEPGRTAEELAVDVLDLLDVQEIDVGLYRGRPLGRGSGRVFGGQVIAQALQAAQRSVEAPKVAHSLHGYFMRAGDRQRPIIYRVISDFEGRSFATRRVVAMQAGKPILNLAASFQVPEDGLEHRDPMPDVPGPEGLASDQERYAAAADRLPERWRDHLLRPRPIEMRPVRSVNWLDPSIRPARQQVWLRLAASAGDDPSVHRALLAYVSDMVLLGTGMMPHGLTWQSPDLRTASLDHAVWFHEPCRVDDWLLYDCDSPWAGSGRSLNRGRIFDRTGRLVASTAQEGMLRVAPVER